MDKIRLLDINFNKIKMINTEATQSTIYIDRKYYYKIFNHVFKVFFSIFN